MGRGFKLGTILCGSIAAVVIAWPSEISHCTVQSCNYANTRYIPNTSATDDVWSIPNPLRPTFSYEGDPTYSEGAPTRHEYYDLRAQERVAHATDWIAWVTLISSIVGAVGLGALFYTLNLHRSANNIAQLIGQAQVRSYVGIKSIQVVRGDPPFQVSEGTIKKFKTIWLNIIVENTGQSPARDIVVSSYLDNRLHGSTPNPARDKSVKRKFYLGAGSVHMIEEGVMFSVGDRYDRLYVELGQSTDDPSEQTAVYLDGTVSYTDCFNVRRTFEWSYVFSGYFTGGPGVGRAGHMLPNYVKDGKDTSFLRYSFVTEERIVSKDYDQ